MNNLDLYPKEVSKLLALHHPDAKVLSAFVSGDEQFGLKQHEGMSDVYVVIRIPQTHYFHPKGIRNLDASGQRFLQAQTKQLKITVLEYGFLLNMVRAGEGLFLHSLHSQKVIFGEQHLDDLRHLAKQAYCRKRYVKRLLKAAEQISYWPDAQLDGSRFDPNQRWRELQSAVHYLLLASHALINTGLSNVHLEANVSDLACLHSERFLINPLQELFKTDRIHFPPTVIIDTVKDIVARRRPMSPILKKRAEQLELIARDLLYCDMLDAVMFQSPLSDDVVSEQMLKIYQL